MKHTCRTVPQEGTENNADVNPTIQPRVKGSSNTLAASWLEYIFYLTS